MKLGVPREQRDGERRVALVPDVISKFTALGLSIQVERGAGLASGFGDSSYEEAGATIVEDALVNADVIASVNALAPDRLRGLKPGTIAISFLAPSTHLDTVAAARDAGVSAVSLELVPRISRAQSMDALTSQALCAGYRAALVGAELSPRFFPLLMTAAGTVTPARVLVLGAGVAGLQAIATARRLGAIVSAYDVRASSADEVKSMGATFVDLGLDSLEGAGGYAREMTEERAAKQRELLTPFIAESDVVITTAAVPGRAAPRLMTADMVAAMKSGAVIVDMAAETGGNVEGSVAGQVITTANGVALWGGKDVPSQLPFHASQLFSRNILSLVTLMTKEGNVTLDFDDEIIDAAVVTHDRQVRFAPAREALSGSTAEGGA
jgi:H+-translocating NAD(P) transhydrogenase subunit alpha